MPQTCNLDGISMNIQEDNSARYFRVQSEREQTLVTCSQEYNESNCTFILMPPSSGSYYRL